MKSVSPFVRIFVAVLSFTVLALSGCGGGNDTVSRTSDLVQYTPRSNEPAFFVHVSDTHLGLATSSGEVLMKAFLREVVPVLQPLATVHTGDMVNEGYSKSSWESYKSLFTTGIVKYPQYIDILGNHDTKSGSDPESSLIEDGKLLFDTHAQAPTRHGFTQLERAGLSPVRLIRTNTADSPTNNNNQNIYGYFSSDQQQALYTHPDRNQAVDFNVVLGHSPVAADYLPVPSGHTSLENLGAIDVRYMYQITEGNGRMKELIGEFNAPIYLCGHVHKAGLEWLNNSSKTLVVRADAFGKNGLPSGFWIVAYDGESPADRHAAVKLVRISDATKLSAIWPIVFITAPANSNLGDADFDYDKKTWETYQETYHANASNPTTTAFTTDQTVMLRTMVFSPETVTSVSYMIDDRPSSKTPLASVIKTDGRVWAAGLSLAGLAAGPHTVTVTATRSNGTTGSDKIWITVK